jgi:TRAP-type C4-dicarboxylate transport system permease small subunit
MNKALPLPGRFRSSVRLLNELAIQFSALLIVVMAILIVSGVFSRYLLALPIVWIDELISTFIPLLSMLVTSYLIERKGHVSVDLLVNRMAAKRARLCVLFSVLCGLVVSVSILVSGWQSVVFLYEYQIRSPSLLGIPDWVSQLSLPLGGVLMSLSCLALFRDLLSQPDNKEVQSLG